MDVEHADDEAVQDVELAESKKEVHKEPVAGPSTNIYSLFDAAGEGSDAEVDDAPDEDHAHEDEGKADKSAEDVDPCDSVVLISVIRSLKAFLPVYSPKELGDLVREEIRVCANYFGVFSQIGVERRWEGILHQNCCSHQLSGKENVPSTV